MATAVDTVTRVLVVDDHPVVHLGLRALFDQEPSIDVVATAYNSEEALDALERTSPELVIADLSLGQLQHSGLQLVRAIRDRAPHVRVLVLTMHDETLYAGRAMRAGAHGYVTKRDAVRDLVSAINEVMGGGRHLKPGVEPAADGGSVARIGRNEENGTTVRSLSERELEVYEMIGHGLSTREIGERLSVSVKTVETHRTRIKAKLGITSTQQLVRNAVQWATLETDAPGSIT